MTFQTKHLIFYILSDLDGREIEFPTTHRPAARFLYYHFLMMLLHCRHYRHYRQPGWEEVWAKLKTCQPWPTPGRYLRESMLVGLAKATGVDINDDIIEKLTQEHTFSTVEHLSTDEEEEIVWRIQDTEERRGHGDGEGWEQGDEGEVGEGEERR